MTGPDLDHSLSRLGITQGELADRLGLSPNTVSRYVCGHLAVPKYVAYVIDLLTRIRTLKDC